MPEAVAPAKLNLALVVGPLRADGRHEVVSLMVPLALADRVSLGPADELAVDGFEDDTLVRGALEALAAAAGRAPAWKATIEKRIPLAAGLGGGSSDAAAALRLANETLDEPIPRKGLHELAAGLGADVPFFLEPGPKIARGDGTDLEAVELRADFGVVLVLPHGVTKASTAAVYADFDARSGERGFDQRAAAFDEALQAGDFAGLPPNDLASSPLARTLAELGALRADVTGAGPAVYGLFEAHAQAEEAAKAVAPLGRVWVDKPGW